MFKRVTVAQFYHQPAPVPLLQLPGLVTASFQDGLFLAANSDFIYVYSLQQEKLLHKIQLPREGRVSNIVAFNQLICFHFQGEANLWTFCNDSLKQMQTHLAPITCLHRHRHHLLTASQDLTIRVWIQQGETIAPFAPHHALFGHSSPVSCLASVDSLFLSGAMDRNVIVWQESTARLRKEFQHPIALIVWCQESDQLAIGLSSGTVNILSLKPLRQANKLVVSRQISGMVSLALVGLSEVDGSFVMMGSGSGLEVAQINLGQVVARVELGHLGTVVGVKTIKALTLVAVQGKGLFLLNF